MVEAADPFATLPAPVGFEIQLAPDTLYRFCGDVDIGANTLVATSTTVIAGDDPLVDSVTSSARPTVRLPDGGTVKDLAIRSSSFLGVGVQVGVPGGSLTNAVIFNVSVAAAEVGILVLGSVTGISIARALIAGSLVSIQLGEPETRSTVAAISIDQALLTSPAGAAWRGVLVAVGSGVGSFSVSQSLFTALGPADIGIEIDTANVATIRASSIAFSDPGATGATPAAIAQPPPLPTATLGSAVQGEAVGCTGFSNSLQRGSATIQNALTVISAAGTPVPIGQPVDSYTLDPSSVRISLVGATAPTQVLRFDRLAPYSGLVAVSVSVEVAVGFTFTPRVVRCGVLKNGVPIGVPFAGTTPDFSSAAPVSLSFATPTALVGGDELQVLISNETDAANLFVRAARVTVT